MCPDPGVHSRSFNYDDLYLENTGGVENELTYDYGFGDESVVLNVDYINQHYEDLAQQHEMFQKEYNRTIKGMAFLVIFLLNIMHIEK